MDYHAPIFKDIPPITVLHRRILPQRPRCGFSLVEVALALGIFGFAIIPIIGIIGTGITVSRDAIESSTLTQITRATAALVAGNPSLTTCYFTEDGQETTVSGSGACVPVYKVEISRKTLSDAAEKLLARNVAQIKITRAQAADAVVGRSAVFSSLEPVDLQDYFE